MTEVLDRHLAHVRRGLDALRVYVPDSDENRGNTARVLVLAGAVALHSTCISLQEGLRAREQTIKELRTALDTERAKNARLQGRLRIANSRE